MKRLCLLLLLSLVFGNVYGQESYQIDGIVNTQDNSPLLYGDVILMSGVDSIPLAHTIINDGVFVFEEIEEGPYLVNISCLGYDKIYHPFLLSHDISLEFQLTENTRQLREATVTATRNTITNENGNIKIGIVNSMFANQPSTIDMLTQLPTVLVGSNGNGLSIIGKGTPLIYLENQRITLDDLIAIPLESIQSVEIINNPSAKYEAEGRSVLLITRLKSLSDGYKIQLSETAAFTRNFNNYARVNANFKKNKLELRTNFTFNDLVIWESYESETEVLGRDLTLSEEALSTGSRPQYIWSSGLHYQINEKSYLSAYAYNRTFSDDAALTSESEVQDSSSYTQIKTLSDDTSDRKFFSSNINFNRELPAGNLFIGAQYSNYGRNLSNAISNNIDNTSYIPTQSRFQDFEIDAYTTRIDLEQKVRNVNVEAGLNYYFADAIATSEINFIDSGLDDNFLYDYEESNLAAYAQFSGKHGKLNYSGGLRSETIEVKGQFRSDDTPLIDRNNTFLFPRAMLSFPVDSNYMLTLNYAKSISRPHYLNSSSISTYISPYVEYTRNVNLKPSLTQELTLTLQRKNQSLNLRFFKNDNPDYTNRFYQPAINRIQQQPDNFDQDIGMSIQLVSPFSYKFWRVTNVLMLTYSKTTDPRFTQLSTAPYPYFYTSHNFRLSSSMNAGFSFYLIGNSNTGASEMRPISNLSFSFSKTFFEKLIFSIQLNDVYRGVEWGSRIITNDVATDITYFSDIKSLQLSLRYSFGKILKSNYKNKDVDEQLDRMR